MKTLAIDIGGTKFSLAVFDENSMVRRETRPTDRAGGPEAMLAGIVRLARDWQRQTEFACCGIGFGGPVNFATQRLAFSTHVPGWKDFDLLERLTRALGIPAVMDNDANTGAIGEYMFGAGRGCSSIFYLTLSTGIGGGIVSNGKVWRGADSWAGEIGHLTVRPDGPICLCGARGCLERLCSGLWIERDHGRPAAEMLREEAFVRTYVADLALGLKACIMLLNPSRIVIGGGIGKAGDALFLPLREELGRQITDWSGARVDVVPAALADDSVLYGALLLAREPGSQ